MHAWALRVFMCMCFRQRTVIKRKDRGDKRLKIRSERGRGGREREMGRVGDA